MVSSDVDTRAIHKSPDHHFNPQDGDSKKRGLGALKINSLNTNTVGSDGRMEQIDEEEP